MRADGGKGVSVGEGDLWISEKIPSKTTNKDSV